MSLPVQFILNDKEVKTSEPAGTLVLDYLRRTEKLMGTKEGCKEGDCGACMVLVGELHGQQVTYQPVTSCLMPIGELHGKHLATIEGLNMERLSPVQQAIVDSGGSQCGFCTPGFVVSLTGYLMSAGFELNRDGIKYALGGNLCRCTGYASLKRAGDILVDKFADGFSSSNGRESNPVDYLIKNQALPEYFKTIPARLKKIPELKVPAQKNGSACFIAGGTDIYVQKGEQLPEKPVSLLNLFPEMKGIRRKNGRLHIGALTTFEALASHPEVQKIIPDIKAYMHFNASWQIRNRATVGGNIVNASPIGDVTALLLVLEATLVLKDGKKQRTVPLKTFYKGYKKLDKTPAEILTEIIVPVPAPGAKIHFEKVAKRKTLDIASVNSAIKIRAADGVIVDINLTMGGVAPVPLFMQKTCDYLLGKVLNRQEILSALQIADRELSPISDIRGSADYKRLLVRQLLIAHFTWLFPEKLTVREFYETP
ncbi:MAG: FAD binding domain-containing protein [bacterium]